MKTERYIVEIEMPDGDSALPLWLRDMLQSDADIEDEGRWKVSVKEPWKPSDEQMKQLKRYCPDNRPLTSLYEQLKKLREE